MAYGRCRGSLSWYRYIYDNGRRIAVESVRVCVLVLALVCGSGVVGVGQKRRQCGGRDCGRAQAPS
jgi:hypothetical protein